MRKPEIKAGGRRTALSAWNCEKLDLDRGLSHLANPFVRLFVQTTSRYGVLVDARASFRLHDLLFITAGTRLQSGPRFGHRHSIRSLVIPKRPRTLGPRAYSLGFRHSNSLAKQDPSEAEELCQVDRKGALE